MIITTKDNFVYNIDRYVDIAKEDIIKVSKGDDGVVLISEKEYERLVNSYNVTVKVIKEVYEPPPKLRDMTIEDVFPNCQPKWKEQAYEIIGERIGQVKAY